MEMDLVAGSGETRANLSEACRGADKVNGDVVSGYEIGKME